MCYERPCSGTLKRLYERHDDFTPAELPLLDRYFDYVARNQQPNLLARLWDRLPAGVDHSWPLEKRLNDAALHGDVKAVEFLLGKALQKMSPTAWRKQLNEYDPTVLDNAVGSRSVQTVQAVLGCLDRHGGASVARGLLPDAAKEVDCVPVLDRLVEEGTRRGGKPLLRKMFQTGWAVRRLVDSGLGTGKPLDPDLPPKLLPLICEAGGVREIVTGMIDGVELLSNKELRNQQPLLRDLFNHVGQLGGEQAVGDLLSRKNCLFAWHASTSGAADLIRDTIMPAVDRLTDRQLAARIDDEIDNHFILPFNEELRDGIEHAKAGEDRSPEVLDAYLNVALYSKSREDGFPKNAGTFGSPALRSAVIRQIVASGEIDNLQKLSELHVAQGRRDIYPEALLHLGDAIKGGHVEMFRDLVDYADRQFGQQYVQSLLARGIDGQSPVDALISGDVKDEKALKTFLDAARSAGSLDFTTDLIRPARPAFALLEKLGEGAAINLLLENMTEGGRKEAEKELSPEWFELRQGRRTAFWQNKGSGQERWRGMTGDEAPHPSLADHSPYRFKPKLYDATLEYTKIACEIEGNTGAEVHAYKLATLFSSQPEIDRYLNKFVCHWRKGETGPQPVHDACLFELPKRGEWNPKHWSRLVLAEGPDAFPFLRRADELEAALDGNPFPGSTAGLRSLLTQCEYPRRKENPTLARLAAETGLPQESFTALLDFHLKNAKTGDLLPDVTIDGASIGHSDFYMTRLPPGDPQGYFLGQVSESCQSVGEQGEPCALYGMTSRYSGFYTWRRKTDGAMTPDDTIVAQSWAWIGQDDALVLDSFERRRSIHDRLAQPFIEQFAHQVVGQHRFDDKGTEHVISAVRLGGKGQTPPLNVAMVARPSQPIDYTGRYGNGTPARDSETQYAIQPVDHARTRVAELPPPVLSGPADRLARDYIERTVQKLEDRYGMLVKTGIELECYAVGTNGLPAAHIVSVKTVQADLKAVGLAGRFDDENTIDYYGQYEIATPVAAPLATVALADKLKGFLERKAPSYGLGRFDFSSLPFEGKEASSAHVSVSLWDKQTAQPLFSTPERGFSDLMVRCTHEMLDVQRHTVLAVAENDNDYARFSNTEWSPGAIRAGFAGNAGISLRMANASNLAVLADAPDPAAFRLENRLPAGGASLMIAMATTLAGVERAVEQHFSSSAPPSRNVGRSHALPATRRQAIDGLRQALGDGKLAGPAEALFRAVLKRHPAPAQAPNPAPSASGNLRRDFSGMGPASATPRNIQNGMS